MSQELGEIVLTSRMFGQFGDAQLVAAHLQGDERASNEIVMRFWNRLVGYLFVAFTHHREDAEDITQKTMMRAFRAMEKYDNRKASLSTWLHMIARRLGMNYVRDQDQFLFLFSELPDGELAEQRFIQAVSLAPLQDEECSRREEQEYARVIVSRALSGVGQIHREVLLLHIFSEMTYPEVSQVMGIPLGTTKSRIFNGKRMFAEQVQLIVGSRELV